MAANFLLRAYFRSIVGNSPTLVQQRQQHQQQIYQKVNQHQQLVAKRVFLYFESIFKVVLDSEKDEHVINVPDEPPLSG